jgi:hypothetical protein
LFSTRSLRPPAEHKTKREIERERERERERCFGGLVFVLCFGCLKQSMVIASSLYGDLLMVHKVFDSNDDLSEFGLQIGLEGDNKFG